MWCESHVDSGNPTQAAELWPMFIAPNYPSSGQIKRGEYGFTPGINSVSGQQETPTDRAYSSPPHLQCEPPLKKILLPPGVKTHKVQLSTECSVKPQEALHFSISCSRPCLGGAVRKLRRHKCQSLGGRELSPGPPKPRPRALTTLQRAPPHTRTFSPLLVATGLSAGPRQTF